MIVDSGDSFGGGGGYGFQVICDGTPLFTFGGGYGGGVRCVSNASSNVTTMAHNNDVVLFVEQCDVKYVDLHLDVRWRIWRAADAYVISSLLL